MRRRPGPRTTTKPLATRASAAAATAGLSAGFPAVSQSSPHPGAGTFVEKKRGSPEKFRPHLSSWDRLYCLEAAGPHDRKRFAALASVGSASVARGW